MRRIEQIRIWATSLPCMAKHGSHNIRTRVIDTSLDIQSEKRYDDVPGGVCYSCFVECFNNLRHQEKADRSDQWEKAKVKDSTPKSQPEKDLRGAVTSRTIPPILPTSMSHKGNAKETNLKMKLSPSRAACHV
jgi:hypothetical protein